MVAASFTVPEMNARWLLYLALSICVNVLIVQAISMDLPKPVLMEMPSIKLNLRALSTAKLSAAQPRQGVPLPTKRVVNVPVTTKNAKKKVPVQVVKPLPAPKLEKPVLQIDNQNSMPEAKQTFESELEMKLPDTFQEKVVRMSGIEHTDATQEAVAGIEEIKLNKEASATSVIHEANYRKQTAPLYPQRAFELGQEGTVTLHAEVMTNGLPGALKVMESSGYRLLDTAAVAAVKQGEFEPTNVNGRAIVSWVKVPVNFVIKQ